MTKAFARATLRRRVLWKALLLTAAATSMAGGIFGHREIARSRGLSGGGSRTLRGTGLYRSDEAECLRSLPQLEARVEALGLSLARPAECSQVLGEPDAYEPEFSIETSEFSEIHTALGAPLSSLAGCESSLHELRAEVLSSADRLLEAGCVAIHVAQTEGDDTEELYQPMFVILTR